MFHTDQHRHIRGLVSPDGQPAVPDDDWDYAVEITAEQDVVAPRGQPPPRNVQFNVVLEQLVLGGAPREAVKMGLLLVLALSFTYWRLVPRARTLLLREVVRRPMGSGAR